MKPRETDPTPELPQPEALRSRYFEEQAAMLEGGSEV
jgi:hypothetical protein